MSKRLKLMSEYGCCSLWELQEGYYIHIGPEELPLSEDLKLAIHRWAVSFDETLNDDYPPDSGFARPEDEEAFEAEGLRLWHELQTQLRGTHEVVYFSQRSGQVLERLPSTAEGHPVPTPADVSASVGANPP